LLLIDVLIEFEKIGGFGETVSTVNVMEDDAVDSKPFKLVALAVRE